MKRKILIIDDDMDLAMITMDMLTDHGYEVLYAKDSNEAYVLLEKQTVHLILLDINLPEVTGFEVCRELRTVSTVPVVFASARTSENDRITGLNMGGDDYLPKPYSLKELLARINALIRRTYAFSKEEEPIAIGNIIIDITGRSVTKNGKQTILSLKEYDLLVYMAGNKNRALSKEELLREVWGTYSEVELSSVAVHIRWLREKLEEEPSNPQYIKTIWGVGYSICDEK